MKVLVTGANGFVGRCLCEALIDNGVEVSAVVRRPEKIIKGVELIVKNLSAKDDFHEILNGIDAVIHLAGRAHVMKENTLDPYHAYHVANVEITKVLAEQAASCGVKRFIFLSSIKVNGESTYSHPFSENDTPRPEDDYGKTKYEAEKVVNEIAKSSAMEVVIIRPPLVYGEGVKANFKNLIKISQLSIPIPLGAIHNKRSLVYIENLVGFIMTCLTHPNAANQTFLVSDDDDVSTTQLMKHIKKASNKKTLLVPIPQSWLKVMFKVVGKQSLSNRLCNNLQVDISKAKAKLNWHPPYSVEYGIVKTVNSS